MEIMDEIIFDKDFSKSNPSILDNDIDDIGKTLIINRSSYNENKGIVQIYKLKNNKWYKFDELNNINHNNNLFYNKYYGYSANISGNGKKFILGNPWYNNEKNYIKMNNYSNRGIIDIYHINNDLKLDYTMFRQTKEIITNDDTINKVLSFYNNINNIYNISRYSYGKFNTTLTTISYKTEFIIGRDDMYNFILDINGGISYFSNIIQIYSKIKVLQDKNNYYKQNNLSFGYDYLNEINLLKEQLNNLTL